MKLLKLGKRLAPADQKVPLWLGQKLAATPEGFDLGVSGLGPVAFTRLQAVATCVTVIRGTPALVMLLAFEGLERPFVVEATAVAAPTFGVTPQPLPEGNVRQVVTQLVRKLPGVVIDDGTYEFLKGQAPRDVGRRIADLVQPIIRIVKDVAAQAPSAAVPASPSPPPATPSPPPATPSPPLAAPSPPLAAPSPPPATPSPPPAAPSPPPATPSPPPAAPSPPPVATSSIPRAAPEPTVRGESPAVPPAPPPRAPAPPGPQPPQVRAHRSETLSPGASAARFVSQEGPCWYDDRKGSLVYMTANELFSAKVRSRPKAEDILRYGQDPRVMKGVKATGVPFRRIERVVADDGLGRAEIRYLRGDAAKGGEKSKDLRIPFHSKTSGASLLRRLGEKLGPAWIRRKSQRGKGRVAIVMWKPLLSAVVPWLGLFFLFRSAPAPGCAIVVLAAGGVVVAAVLVRGVMRMVKAPAEVEELVPASAASAQ